MWWEGLYGPLRVGARQGRATPVIRPMCLHGAEGFLGSRGAVDIRFTVMVKG